MIGWHGSIYLLARELDAFGDFLRQTAPAATTAGVTLPRAFQEAALLWMAQGHELPAGWQVQNEVAERFDQFRQAVQNARRDTNGVARLYRDYGHTFWFYFYQQTEPQKSRRKNEDQLQTSLSHLYVQPYYILYYRYHQRENEFYCCKCIYQSYNLYAFYLDSHKF